MRAALKSQSSQVCLLISCHISLFLFRREAVPVLLGRLRVAVRAVGRADAAPEEAHGRQALQVRPVRPQLLQVGPPRAPHEETPIGSE